MREVREGVVHANTEFVCVRSASLLRERPLRFTRTVSTISSVRVNKAELTELVPRLAKDLEGDPAFAIVMASPAIDLADAMKLISERWSTTRVIGTTTSGEFTEAGDGKESVAVLAVCGDYIVHAGLGRGLAGGAEGAVRAALSGQPTTVTGYPHRTGVVLLDPLAGHGEEASLLIAAELGDQPLVGGAAGDDLAMRKTLVGHDGIVASDAIMVMTLFSRRPLGIGVKHGHRALSATSHRVTKADGSVVLEVDGRPAWDVWLEETGDRARSLGLDPEGQPGAFLLRFEAGLRVAGEFKVRAPLAPKPGGGILFATAMDEGTVFNIMESDVASQVDSAVEAANSAREALGGAPVAGAVVFDCICRKLILGDEYDRMVRAVSSALGGAPLAGFETYGEIAMNSGDMSGFHNTTTVVLAFPGDG